MPLSPADEQVVADMRQREFHIKARQRAADTIQFKVRRFRGLLSFVVAVVLSLVATGIVALVVEVDPGPPRMLLVLPTLGAAVFLSVIGAQHLWETQWGRRLLAHRESRLRREHSSELHAGRRWLQFHYDGEDISAYVPQILYFLDGDQRFDSVADALAFARAHYQESTLFAARALERFDTVVSQTNALVVSSADENGQPSNRIMRFVTTDRPGVWYVTTAPEGPKVHEFDQGRVAVVTAPTDSGATITSNRVRIRRAAVPFQAIVDLYQEQVPGYVDGMTEPEMEREVVYELSMQSARVDTWLDHELVHFTE